MKKTLLLILSFCVFNVYAQTTVNLNPSKDNSIYSESTKSAGLGRLFSGQTCDNKIRRCLIQFDISSIPAGATITNVTLTVNVDQVSTSATVDNFNIHRVTTAWEEGTSVPSGAGGTGATAVAPDATWADAMLGTSTWTSAGGDYISTSSAAVSFTLTFGDQIFSSNSSLVSDVQNWLDGVNLNYGWILIGDEVNACTARRMGSKDSGTKPVLSITYTTPLGIEDTQWTSNVSIYPNPSNGVVTISTEEILKKAEVINFLGQVVKTIDLSTSKTSQELNLCELTAGVYYIKVQNEKNQSSIKKIVIR